MLKQVRAAAPMFSEYFGFLRTTAMLSSNADEGVMICVPANTKQGLSGNLTTPVGFSECLARTELTSTSSYSMNLQAIFCLFSHILPLAYPVLSASAA